LVVPALQITQSLVVDAPGLRAPTLQVALWGGDGHGCLLPRPIGLDSIPPTGRSSRPQDGFPRMSARKRPCGPSGGRRTPWSVLLEAPVHTAEFLVVDTETNGLAGEACELTEVGAVLVGGGELHERWETLLRVRAPLSRGIQRFAGITHEMVDEAPPAELALPELARQLSGRVLVAHSAGFDRRVLRQAFGRAGLPWEDPPSLCTVSLARRLHPLARQRRLKLLAESLGIEVELTHRALADAETC